MTNNIITKLCLLSLLITALFSPSFHSENAFGNYDIFTHDGTLLTSDSADDIHLFSAGDGSVYLSGDEIRFVNGITANDKTLVDFGGVTWHLKNYAK
jgi:hypothetical protein